MMTPISPETASTPLASHSPAEAALRSASRLTGVHGDDRELPWWPRPVRNALLVLCDSAVLLLAAAVAYYAWAWGVRSQPVDLYVSLLWLLPLYVAAYAQAGLYPGFGIGAVETLRRFTIRTSLVSLAVAAAVFALKVPLHYSRVTFVLMWASSLILLPFGRFLFLSRARRWPWWHEPAVVVLDDEQRDSKGVISGLAQALTLGYRPEGVLLSSTDPAPEEIDGLPVLGNLEAASDVAEVGIRVAFAFDERDVTAQGSRDNRLLDRLQSHFRHVILVTDFGNAPVERLEVRNLGTAVGVGFQNQLLSRHNRLLKRGADLVVASAALLVATPIIILAALALAVADSGPVFYRQTREGQGGCPIDVWKLRTMFVDAERRLEDHLRSNPEARAEWEARFKLRDDPRVIPYVGTFLRRWSIDELPQLWNVIKGDMSIVGPRPLPEYHVQAFDADFLDLRRRVRPGITGLWQVMVRASGTNAEKHGLDSYYIRNWSPWLDLYVLARTVVTVLCGDGAY